MEKGHVAIVGGGVAGVTAALALGTLGVRVTLFEKGASLVGGPPFCHLHAGGNLYREISDDQCVALLRQSVEFARLYPFVVDRRPTVIAVPTWDEGSPEALLPRLALLRDEYAKLVAADPANEVLGPPEGYFRLFDEAKLRGLAERSLASSPPENAEAWMVPAAKRLDVSKVKFPLILVQEYGLNMFRLAAGAKLALEAVEEVDLRLETSVTGIEPAHGGYRLAWRGCGGESGIREADYLINAAGFLTGSIDDMLGIRERRMVEFKAAYTSLWRDRERFWPEVIFHGKRGTPRGMGQFTPYAGSYVQLHGMTKEITLFENGLAASTEESSQPRLPETFLEWIEKGWPEEVICERTRRAIDFLAYFIPGFAEAEVGGPPLFGAQQIPGDDPELRVAEVAFPRARYARCEIVKVSSATDMARAIASDLAAEGLCDAAKPPATLPALEALEEAAVAKEAARIALSRGYPEAMASLNVG